MLKGKTVVLGVTGCIAAYKACEIVSSLKKKGATVIVIMTPHSTEFVQPLSFETLSGNRVITDLFDRDFDFEVDHVALAKIRRKISRGLKSRAIRLSSLSPDDLRAATSAKVKWLNPKQS